MLRNCVRCDGGGSVTCTLCEGYGYRSPTPSGANSDMVSKMCSTCNGAGEVTCPVCHGSGKVEY